MELDGAGSLAEGAGGAGVPTPNLSMNQGVRMPSRAELEEYQLIEMMQEPMAFSKEVPETQQEVDLLLDSNYAIISQLVRLRHTREAGKPRRVEHKLMAMLEKNLSKLVACQSPSALVSPRTAQATRAMMRQAKDTELAHAQAAAAQAAAAHEAAAAPQQTHMMQGAAVHPQGGMQMMPGGMAGGGAAGGGGAMQGMTSQGQMQQHRLHQPAHTLYGGGSGGGVDSSGGGGGMF